MPPRVAAPRPTRKVGALCRGVQGGVADAQNFRGRLAHLVGEAEADAEFASKFAGAASQILGASQAAQPRFQRRGLGAPGRRQCNVEGVSGTRSAGLVPERVEGPGALVRAGAPKRKGARVAVAPVAHRASVGGLRHVAALVSTRSRRGAAADVERETARLDALRKEISELTPRLEAGGRKARDALIRLMREVSEPNAKTAMKAMGVLASASRLMKSPASDVELQRLAGSMITHLTGMPVSSEISDDASGSRGQVNIVIPRASRVYGPDRAMLAQSAAARSGSTRAPAPP